MTERFMTVIQKNWQTLIKPTKLNIEGGTDPARTATIRALTVTTIAKSMGNTALSCRLVLSFIFYGQLPRESRA